MQDLELCQFIRRYTPYNLNDKSTVSRYTIADPYLQYYVKFIKPEIKAINDGAYKSNPLAGLNRESYYKWLGFAFERFCRRYHYVIAKILGFSGERISGISNRFDF